MKVELEAQLKDDMPMPDSPEPTLSGKGTRGIRRRDFVKAFMAATVAPTAFLGQATPPPPPTGLPAPAPVPWMRGLNPATPIPPAEAAEVVAESELRFFTSTQMATLTRLSDVLVPSIASTPGAVEAGTPAFLDFFVGESLSDRKAMYQGGLDWLDAESKKQFSKPFAALETAQADRLLKPWLRTWMTDHPPTEAHADFINAAHADIREATVNSRAWSKSPDNDGQESTREGLYWHPVDPGPCWDGTGENRHATAAR
jgi:hypothetical protein